MATLYQPQSELRNWESALLALASDQARASAAPDALPRVPDRPLLTQAYAHCARLTRAHSQTFYLATTLLPRGKRQAIRALYAFSRRSDDIVDSPTGDAAANLAAWRRKAMSATPPAQDLVAIAWSDARSRYHIPQCYTEQLISGVARDLTQTRYATFADLAIYCYGVASTVGLMSMHIIGFSGEQAFPYAIKLGIALQLTNILRDVAEDWRAGRVYLPLDELVAFGLTQDDLARAEVDNRWRELMRFQIMRNRRLYAEAWPGLALLSKDGRFAVAAAADLYRSILDDIEAHDYDVFDRRAHVSDGEKVRRLPGIWWRSRHLS